MARLRARPEAIVTAGLRLGIRPTGRALAHALGMSPATMARVMAGSAVAGHTAATLASGLHVPIDTLFESVEDESA